jgi:hypothetical protein
LAEVIGEADLDKSRSITGVGFSAPILSAKIHDAPTT